MFENWRILILNDKNHLNNLAKELIRDGHIIVDTTDNNTIVTNIANLNDMSIDNNSIVVIVQLNENKFKC